MKSLLAVLIVAAALFVGACNTTGGSSAPSVAPATSAPSVPATSPASPEASPSAS
jgi:hypothetical protein